MSKEELDGLFRNKLQEHELEPTPGAWERLESSLPDQGERGIFHWWHAAAAILLLAVAGWIFWPASAPDQTQLARQVTPENTPAVSQPEGGKTATEGMETDSGEDVRQVPSPANGDMETQHLAAAPNDQVPVTPDPSGSDESGKKTEIPVLPKTDRKEQVAVIETPEPPLSPEDLEKTDPVAVLASDRTENSPGSVTSPSAGRSNTLTISIEEFDEALLPDQPDSTGEGEKSTKGLKKLWAAVKNAPSSLESGFGELREAKNDLLSLDKETEKP